MLKPFGAAICAVVAFIKCLGLLHYWLWGQCSRTAALDISGDRVLLSNVIHHIRVPQASTKPTKHLHGPKEKNKTRAQCKGSTNLLSQALINEYRLPKSNREDAEVEFDVREAKGVSNVLIQHLQTEIFRGVLSLRVGCSRANVSRYKITWRPLTCLFTSGSGSQSDCIKSRV